MSRLTARFSLVILLFCASQSLAQQPEQPLPPQITQAAVGRVKSATVLLHVVSSDGNKGDGSGFFALKPGIVITNAHVLGMLSKQAGQPREIEVVVNSGEANETKLKGTVVGVDRDNDLGIVRVTGTGLPRPLEIENNRSLFETQKVYVFGFPFGVQLGKNITVSESSISSLRRNGTDRVQQIQVNGGIHQGNSGGPLVNTEGKVVGVAVSIIRGTQINFAIPMQFVTGLMSGRVTESWLGEAYSIKDKIAISAKFTCLDPFDQIKELHVDVWEGMPGPALAESDTLPKARPGDGARQRVKLAFNKGIGEQDISLPAIAPGKVCWLQPVIVTEGKKTYWGSAIASSSPLMPLRRESVQLAPNFDKVPERTLKLKSVMRETFTRGKLKEESSDKVEVDLLEVVSTTDSIFISISYGPTCNIASEIDGRPINLHNETNKMFRYMNPGFIVLPTGGLKSRVSRSINPKVPVRLREDFLNCFTQFCSSMEAAMVPIPNSELMPLAKYNTNIALLVGASSNLTGAKSGTEIAKTIDLHLHCTYQGTRTRNGRTEALMTFDGKVKGRSKGTERAEGEVTGKYAVDIEGGYVSMVQIKIVTEIEGPGGDYRLTFASEIEADRRPGNPLNIAPPRK